MSTKRRNLLSGGGLVVILIAVVVWWFTRPAPAEVDISAAIDNAATASDSPSLSATGTAATSDSPSPSASAATTGAGSTKTATAAGTAAAQTWTVSTDVVEYDFDAPAGTFAGFRIDEELSSVGGSTAVARTPEVTGTATLTDTELSDTSFTANLLELSSDRSRRDGAIQRALNTTEFPDATFALTAPIELGAVPPIGEAIESQATGTMTINGVTNEVTVPLQAALVEADQLVVTTSFEVALADYDITPPSAPIVVGIADTATVEVQVYLVP